MKFEVNLGEFSYSYLNHTIRGSVFEAQKVYIINDACCCTFDDFMILDNLFKVFWDSI